MEGGWFKSGPADSWGQVNFSDLGEGGGNQNGESVHKKEVGVPGIGSDIQKIRKSKWIWDGPIPFQIARRGGRDDISSDRFGKKW